MNLMGGCNMNRIMLINFPIQAYVQKDFSLDSGYNPSLGIISLGTWLELNGYKPIVIDLSFIKLSVKELLEKIADESPAIIGMSVYTENIDMVVATSKLIKESFPDVKIVLGGPHPSLVPEEAISSEYVDFVVRKEGEAVLLELAEAITTNQKLIKFEDIDGLVFKREGKIISNKLRKPISDLDILPIPKRELIGMDKYNVLVCISTSRGCPGKCIYCSATALSGATYRTRYVDNVFLEIVMLNALLKKDPLNVYIVDDTFTAFPERVIKFVELIKYYNPNIKWQCESRVDVMNEELIDQMASAKCVAIQYGIESGSQKVLDSINKGIDLEHAKKIIDYSYKKNIIPVLSFMLGHYCDTKETMQETVDFIKEMHGKYKSEIALSFNTPFPGTWQYTHQDKIGLRIKAKSYKMYSLLDPIVETDEFTINDQRRYFYDAIKYLAHFTRLDKIKRTGGVIIDE